MPYLGAAGLQVVSAQPTAPDRFTVQSGILIGEVVAGGPAATLVPLKPGQRVAVTVATTREQRTVTRTRGELAVGGRRTRPSAPLLEHALSVPLQRDDRDLGRVVDP